MESRARSSLRDVMMRCVEYYLYVDNPEPKTVYMKVTGLFNRSGAAGRQRALAWYDARLKENLPESELVNKMMADLCGRTNLLKDSIKFKRRMLEYLCRYYQKSDQYIEHYVNAKIATMSQIFAKAGAPVSISYEHTRDEVMLEIMKEVTGFERDPTDILELETYNKKTN